jgi:hypothetical protein
MIIDVDAIGARGILKRERRGKERKGRGERERERERERGSEYIECLASRGIE